MTDRSRYPRGHQASARVTTRLGTVFPPFSFTSFSAKNSYCAQGLTKPFLWVAVAAPRPHLWRNNLKSTTQDSCQKEKRPGGGLFH